MEILVDSRVASVIHKHNDYAWRLKFKDNNEIVNVFYHQENNWTIVNNTKVNDSRTR